jgi:hypothetical protein
LGLASGPGIRIRGRLDCGSPAGRTTLAALESKVTIGNGINDLRDGRMFTYIRYCLNSLIVVSFLAIIPAVKTNAEESIIGKWNFKWSIGVVDRWMFSPTGAYLHQVIANPMKEEKGQLLY